MKENLIGIGMVLGTFLFVAGGVGALLGHIGIVPESHIWLAGAGAGLAIGWLSAAMADVLTGKR